MPAYKLKMMANLTRRSNRPRASSDHGPSRHRHRVCIAGGGSAESHAGACNKVDPARSSNIGCRKSTVDADRQKGRPRSASIRVAHPLRVTSNRAPCGQHRCYSIVSRARRAGGIGFALNYRACIRYVEELMRNRRTAAESSKCREPLIDELRLMPNLLAHGDSLPWWTDIRRPAGDGPQACRADRYQDPVIDYCPTPARNVCAPNPAH